MNGAKKGSLGITRRWLVAALLATVGVVVAAAASSGAVADGKQSRVTPKVVPDDGVTALASGGGTLFVGGEFERFGAPTGRFVVFDGLRNRPQPGYPRVSPEVVSAIAPDGRGGWFVGGSSIASET